MLGMTRASHVTAPLTIVTIIIVLLARARAQVDMYALGVVIFEMWHRFDTGMERFMVLNELRTSGALPEEFLRDHFKPARLVAVLTNHDPAERLSATEVLQRCGRRVRSCACVCLSLCLCLSVCLPVCLSACLSACQCEYNACQ